MGKIKLSYIARGNIEGAKEYKKENTEHIRDLMLEADKRIELDKIGYANAYKKAATYLAR
ncbi:MAG: hypothetical protein K5894_11455 [Lachnospiraceae bacterium]|nr:hypothetical protein [Lachnospiraceae bacterium]